MNARTLEPLRKHAADTRRHLKELELAVDLVVVGGGMAGTCCALTAARAGASVVLIQDRPVLGGNASSEMRVKIAGAAGNANRWAREGGVIDEIMIENAHRNPEGNPVLFDHVLLDIAAAEPNLTLLLNTAAFEVEKDRNRITAVRAFCSQNSTMYTVKTRFACDASGDGIIGYLSGASFRVGSEPREEFDESLATEVDYGALLGDSILLQTKDLGLPVSFVPPNYALKDVSTLPKYKQIDTNVDAARANAWWAEFGGRMDTVHESEEIKWEIWRLIFGVWNHLKNSGKFPETANLTLEWVGQLPGKRESRRFEGLYMLTQTDILDQVEHFDAVAYGGFPIDFHPADGAYSEWEEDEAGARLFAIPGTFQIPLRCLISRDVPNLFLGGRLISASHVAFGTTRSMATCAVGGQAVGMAAAICSAKNIDPADLLSTEEMRELQVRLLKTGHYIPGVRLQDPRDLVQAASISASSEFILTELPVDGPRVPLDRTVSQLIPVGPRQLPAVTFIVDVDSATTLRLEVRRPRSSKTHLPGETLAQSEVALLAGNSQAVTIGPDVSVDVDGYLHYILLANDSVSVHTSAQPLTGLMTISHIRSVRAGEVAPNLDAPCSVEYWRPDATEGRNLAISVNPPLDIFGPHLVGNGFARPTSVGNAWVAALGDNMPTVYLHWPSRQILESVSITFDGDFDRYIESTAVTAQADGPFGVTDYQLRANGELLFCVTNNYQPLVTHVFDPPLETDELELNVLRTVGSAPAAVFEIRAYGAGNSLP